VSDNYFTGNYSLPGPFSYPPSLSKPFSTLHDWPPLNSLGYFTTKHHYQHHSKPEKAALYSQLLPNPTLFTTYFLRSCLSNEYRRTIEQESKKNRTTIEQNPGNHPYKGLRAVVSLGGMQRPSSFLPKGAFLSAEGGGFETTVYQSRMLTQSIRDGFLSNWI